ncbi:GRIP and coiled-coil domain-containing protein 2 [Phymastichus coffea]|uniref:GRIP and coiled-coil domain-containing protein 2 n=1 Tax=Phymastichus coffea TaxID=108790 RepID=UPI00273C7E8B|nr:GRIP and coiled-coil domain-containing protein 2 [Phymastichus coffea]
MMEDSILMTTSIQNEMLMSGSTIENENVSENKSNSDEKSNNDETNATIEERYNKLRGLAIKLKKKVSDLSDQNKLLETDNQKLNSEKDELQNKILRMSESVKKLQIIQSQYDKLQDDVELVKNENKRLTKRLESLVLENDSLKDTVNKEKKELAQLTAKFTSFTEENSKLETACEQLEKKVKDLNNELKAESMVRQQKTKECEDLKKSLEAEVRSHKSTRTRLDDMKHDRTSNNVLSLEVANYEKSIDTIKIKLDEETNKRINLEGTVSQHLETIEVLTARISELQDSYLAKTTRITTLEEKNQTLELDAREAKLETSKALKEKESHAREARRLETAKKDLEGKIELLTSEMAKTEEESRSRIKTFQNHIDDLKRETARLNLALENSKRETSLLQDEFENYKLRAQSVLLKTKNIPSNHLEEEVEDCRRQILLLTEKCESYKERTESLMKEIVLLKDERTRGIASEQELISKLTLLRQDSVILMEKYKNQEAENQRLQMNHEKTFDNLRRNYEEEIAKIKKRHEEEMRSIKLEVTLNSTIKSQIGAIEPIPSAAPVSSTPPLVEREECEGSESIESLQQSTKNSERSIGGRCTPPQTPITLTPLDQLLEFPFDEHEVVSRVPKDSPEVIAYKNRVKHLTELLADAERDIAKLTQLNQLLKEDIRRQKRYVEREKEAVNFEYLKNVVFKFCTLENRDERSRLVPVLDTILKLSPEETHKLNEIVSTTGGATRKKNWIPGWSSG